MMGHIFCILVTSLVCLNDVITMTTAAEPGPGKRHDIVSMSYTENLPGCRQKVPCKLSNLQIFRMLCREFVFSPTHPTPALTPAFIIGLYTQNATPVA